MTRSNRPQFELVSYRSRTGRYTLPAVINTTVDTIYPPSVEAGNIPPLTHPKRVHLTVFTGGTVGTRLPDTDPAIPQAPPGGTYQEHDIPFWQAPQDDEWVNDDQPPGTWTWLREN